jgi:ATP synthase protein I
MAGLPRADTIKILGQLSTVGLSFVFALILGFGGGLWLDGQFGTKPWLTLIGFVLGLAAGVLNVVRIMKGVTHMQNARRAEGLPATSADDAGTHEAAPAPWDGDREG